MPRIHLLLLIMIVAVFGCLPRPILGADKPLRIGAWNLEHFGSRTDPRRTDDDLNAIAAKIRNLEVSVLAVSEVNGWRTLRDLAHRIGPEWDGVLGRTGYIGGQPPKQIGVGFLWDNRRVQLVSASDWKNLPRRFNGLHIFHRIPVAACFRAVGGGPDFRLVAVHLKAGFEPSDLQKRVYELTEIKKRIVSLRSTPGEDSDIAVLGDFNHGLCTPEHVTLTNKGLAYYLTTNRPVSSIIHFDNQIDHIVPLTGFDEIQKRTFDVIDNEGKCDKTTWRNRYSDHYPVVVDLNTGPDDDPEASFSVGESPLRPLSQFSN